MSHHLTTETCTQAWEDLAQRLEPFIKEWESGQQPAIAEHLPSGPPALRRIALVEMIKFDLEQRTSRGSHRPLAEYAAEFPELLENGEPPCDLIYEEYHVRRAAKHDVTPREYYDRFPRSAAALRRLLGTEDLSASTQLFNNTRRVDGFQAGSRVDDFDLLLELGKGAFGCVFLARQVSLQRLVAVKISADKGTETQTLAALDHPNIVRVFDQRRLPGQRLRLLYMQFAPGGTLADVVKRVRETPAAARSGAILVEVIGLAVEQTGVVASGDAVWKRRVSAATWPETVCRLGVQLAQALDHAHQKGVLHRDVKPANVLLAADGSPKLADFNISFCSQLEGATPAAYFGGSMAYMSPEQLEACNPSHDRQPEDLDGRSDLFALAVVLWELLHGERPFADGEMTGAWSRMLAEMTKARRTEQPYSPQASRDAVTVRLEQVLRKALAPDAEDRHPNGAALARELLLCLNPRAWDLVNDLASGWLKWVRRWPAAALFPLILIPILLASAFNYQLNYHMYIAAQNEAIQRGFGIMFYPVNLTLFPLGMFLIVSYAWPIHRAVSKLASGGKVETEKLILARHRSLSLGRWVAIVGLLLWLVAGIAFPAGIHVYAGKFPLDGWIHFLLSMGFCGLISCCFPYLAMTWLTVRVFYPVLLGSTTPEVAEQRRLMDLSQQAFRYVALAAVVPMLAALLLIYTKENRAFTTVLIVGGLLGFGAAYYIYQRIRADLAALSVVARPVEMISTATETVDGF